ncbi:hypothetical protein EJC49_06145 [Aquibium carbonis]|uniref:DUF945 domain-containing protein n=2 Tax=Aquibium carbonis TaxID=2495581 RepID=A0A3S0GAF3_9HYPH|nr:hypothetical protein EJC49_06145 [Aquibium carbonis]
MTYLKSKLRSLAIGGLVLAALPQMAHAQSAAEVGERIKAIFAHQGIQLSWTGVTEQGDGLVLQGVSAAMEGLDGAAPIGDVALSDISRDGDTIVVGSVTMPGYNRTQDDMTLSISGVSMTGLQLPETGSADAMNTVMFYDSADIGELTFYGGGQEIVAIRQLHAEMEAADDGSYTFGGAVEEFSINLAMVDDPQSKAVINALGYQTLKGYVEMTGTWDPQDGRLILDQYDTSITDAGTIGMTLDISGYTPQFIQALRDIQTRMAATEGQDQSAQSMAMLGLMQQINLHGATVRFDDDKLTDKVLSFVAAQQGAQPSDIKNQAKAVLPFALAQVGNPELTAAVSAAVNTFLDNPESLEIRIAPANPIPFALLAAGAMTAPQSLPQQLGFGIAANE